MRYNFLYMDPWSADKQVYNKDRCPLYICLSGNSGVGKSTLLKKLSTHLFKQDSYTIAVDEKSVHHSLLPYLFDDTKNYGYLIQINFMIQRALIIKSWLDKGYNLIMERSHIEDYIFINFMFKAGYINRTQHDSYIQLWERISPEEFPDEEMKIKWITGWHAEYQNYIENLPDHLRQRVLVCNRPDDIEVFSDMIIQKAIFLRR